MPDLPYQVFGPSGQCLMEAPENCRYSRSVELDMLEAGYTIRLNGKRITKAELRKDPAVGRNNHSRR